MIIFTFLVTDRKDAQADRLTETGRQTEPTGAGQTEVDQVQAQISEIGLCRLHCADNAGGAFVSTLSGVREMAQWEDNGNGQPVRPGIV